MPFDVVAQPVRQRQSSFTDPAVLKRRNRRRQSGSMGRDLLGPVRAPGQEPPGRLLSELQRRELRVRCLVREPERLRSPLRPRSEAVRGDVVPVGHGPLDRGMDGIDAVREILGYLASLNS